MVDAKKLDALMAWMDQNLGEDLEALLVVDRDGLAISSMMKDGIDEELLGGMAALVDPILKRISTEFASGKFGTGTFDTEDYRIIFTEAGPNAILVLVGNQLANIDDLFPYAYMCSEKVARILDNRPVSPVIPKLTRSGVPSKGSKELRRIVVEEGTFILKTILCGDGSVGKTTLVNQFIEGQFQEDYKSTIGVSIMKKGVIFDEWNVEVRYTIWDMAGQSQFARVRQTYFAGAKAGFLIYDVTKKETFENIKKWKAESERIEKNIYFVLIGNKIDLVDQRVVTTEEGQALAEKLGVQYIETSALNKEIVDEAFKQLAFLFIQKEKILTDV